MLREIVLVLMLVNLGNSQTNQTIDIADIAPKNRVHEPSTVSSSGGESGGDVGTSRQQSPLTIEILSAEVANDTHGATLVFRVRLHNTGKAMIKVPIDPNLADFEPKTADTAYSYRSLDIFLVIKDTNGVLQGASLYGSERIVGSLKDVPPGEMVEIRARTPLNSGNQNAVTKISSQLSVAAGLLLQRNEVTSRGGILHQDSEQITPQIISSNAVGLSSNQDE
jgi:hypothetical protein